MTPELRKAVVSISMVVTLAVSVIVTMPFVNRYSQARIAEVSATGKASDRVAGLFGAALYPTIGAFFGCLALSVGVGYIVAKKLPAADKRAPRRKPG